MKALKAIATIAIAALLQACAHWSPAPEGPPRHPQAFVATAGEDALLVRHAPVLVPANPRFDYNRVGHPRAVLDADGDTRIEVDPAAAVMYARRESFRTGSGGYTNLIYRVHFPRVPYRLLPFHLTAGPNGGLIMILTLDAQQRPLLLTTVHSCGCYLGMIPTEHLPASAYPPDWNRDAQEVFGERLPGRIDYPLEADQAHRVVIRTREGTHRIKQVEVLPEAELTRRYQPVPMTLQPSAELERLPAPAGGETSFFIDSGWRERYVRDTIKPFEMLFMSWWSLDLWVGVDKRLEGDPDEVNPFYTSLKPWARHRSDLRDFPRFLDYWGWRL